MNIFKFHEVKLGDQAVESPKQLEGEIQTLRGSVEKIRETLLHEVRDVKEPAWGIGRDCA